jgi:hypothetical protein
MALDQPGRLDGGMVTSGAGRLPVVLHLAPVVPGASNRLILQKRLLADHWEPYHICLESVSVAPAGDTADEGTRRLPNWPPRREGEGAIVRKAKAVVRHAVNTLVLVRWLWRSEARLLHAHELQSVWPLAFWVLFLRRSAVWDPHDYHHQPGVRRRRPSPRAMRFLERLLVARGVPVLAVSRTMRDKYRRLYPGGKLYVVKNLSARSGGGETAGDEPGERSSAGPTRVVYPGLLKADRIDSRLLLEIGSVPAVELHLLGRDAGDGHAERVRVLLEENGVGNVHLHGAYSPESLLDCLRNYHYALFPYPVITENIDLCLPNKFFQCIEAGLPMLAARTAEMGGLIDEHGLGLTFPAGDYDALVAALESHPASSDSYVAMSGNVVRYRDEQLDYGHQRDTLLDAYADALRGAAP